MSEIDMITDFMEFTVLKEKWDIEPISNNMTWYLLSETQLQWQF